jgi:aldose 1-epimerase
LATRAERAGRDTLVVMTRRTFVLAPLPLMTNSGSYSIESAQSDGLPIQILRDAARQIEVRVAPTLGHNAYSLKVAGHEMMYLPYKTLAELAAKPTLCGNPLLWPWANRIDGPTYRVNGKTYALRQELGNLKPDGNGLAIHGLLQYWREWKLEHAKADENGAELRSVVEFWRHPSLAAQFPFAHAIHMTYRLADGALTVTTEIENLSTEPLPVSLGYHPYFQVTDAPRDAWHVRVPAGRRYKLSNHLVPTGETEPNPHPPEFSLAGTVVDDVFDTLQREPDGWARFELRGKAQRLTVEYGKAYPVAVVYAPEGRNFVCFEPMTAITNAFNATADGWYKDMPVVAPGARWEGVYRIRPSAGEIK